MLRPWALVEVLGPSDAQTAGEGKPRTRSPSKVMTLPARQYRGAPPPGKRPGTGGGAMRESDEGERYARPPETIWRLSRRLDTLCGSTTSTTLSEAREETLRVGGWFAELCRGGDVVAPPKPRLREFRGMATGKVLCAASALTPFPLIRLANSNSLPCPSTGKPPKEKMVPPVAHEWEVGRSKKFAPMFNL